MSVGFCALGFEKVPPGETVHDQEVIGFVLIVCVRSVSTIVPQLTAHMKFVTVGMVTVTDACTRHSFPVAGSVTTTVAVTT